MARFINETLFRGMKKPIKITVLNEKTGQPINLNGSNVTLMLWKGTSKIIKTGDDFDTSSGDAVTMMNREDTENVELGVWRVEGRISNPSFEDVFLKGQVTLTNSKIVEEEENVE